MKKLITVAICILFYACACAQTTNDITDSLANDLKQYTIKIDVGNGNIYLPVKKKAKTNTLTKANFAKRLPFIQPEKYQTLYRDTVRNNIVVREPIGTFRVIKAPLNTTDIKYLVEGRYLKPRVGSFIKLEFINVPRDVEVLANVDFQDKNQEGATAFNNVLSKYQGAFDNSVNADTAKINAEIKKTETQIKETKALLTQEVDNISVINDLNGKMGKLNLNLQSTLTDFNKIIKDLKRGNNSKKISFIDSTLNNILDSLDKIKIPDSLNQNEKINMIKESTSSIRGPLSSLKNILKNSTNSLSELTKKTNETKKIVENQQNDISNTKDIIEKKVDSLFKSIRIKDSLYKSLLDSIYKNRRIKIIPFQVANTDLSIINLQFTRKGQVYAEREILLKNKFGFKLDFSTGFVGTTLRDDNYRLYSRSGDSSAIIDDSKGKFAVGFAFMAHAYFRTGNRFNVALTSGFALNGSNQTVNYILGAAVPLGLEQRFILSAGVLFGKVKTLSSGYKVSSNVDSLASSTNYLNGNNWYKNIQNTGVPLTEKWSNGFYFGITYNLGTLIGNQQKKSFKVN
jgi:hypothetical protein